MEIKQDFIYKGTRILFGEKAKRKEDALNKFSKYLNKKGFNRIYIPALQFQNTFEGKIGDNNNLMYNFKDRGNREICLAPEYTAVCQKLASTQFKQTKDVKMYYISECFRGEKPQKGRYRQFTQLGVEILNPTKDYSNYITQIAQNLLSLLDLEYVTNKDAARGLDYYKEGKGFEININKLGSQKQVCGGGSYEGGIGFAVGIDRILEVWT